MFDNEHSLHLWEKTFMHFDEKQLTDWRERVATLHDLSAILCGYSDTCY
jgi:hypothetical protein